MNELTRRSDKDPQRGGWFIYFGDVQVGHIGMRVGVPVGENQWGWHSGFYPGCDPGQATDGTGATFEEARAEFEQAWNRLLPTRTEAHFELRRQHRDLTAWKYRMHDEHLKLPTETKTDRARCFCGAEISDRSIPTHIQRTAALELEPGRESGCDIQISVLKRVPSRN
jgi:hypothetical protein